ncbi:MAG: hypothetical protein HWN81_02370 [Candidatus Lokiarchaeota archaeon]|nr:hypothetical protein [Candidatus Lokiarchaeota archaeon]
MSLKPVKKKFQFAFDNDSFEEESINLNNITIPFSEFGNSKKLSYLYNGLEEITFKERHLVYQKILLNEFVEEISES